jgi:aminoglycoside phosphotransferase family enzyme
MIVDDQADTIRFLSDAGTHGGAPVETIETHISRLFLAGDRVFKTKRAVRLPYADFSTPELRLAACRKEAELNARTAPGLYLGARRITRAADGAIAFDGPGDLIDGVVEMVRFDQSCLFDRLAAAGRLTPELMTRVARMIARFHEGAPVAGGGGAANIAGVLDINEAGFATGAVFGKGEVARLVADFRTGLDRHAPLLDRRAAAGRIRRCHGDLHLRNICLLDGQPRLFDCIEFNDAIATTDVLYDLAFLLMDLWHGGLVREANLVANRYLDETGDEEGFVLLPFFMAVRAAVRAHVTATQAADGDPTGKLAADARTYFDLARSLLAPQEPRLVAIGGLSGSGKSTVADLAGPHLGAPPGARLLESDRIRKAMHGVAAETRLPADAYRPEASERVYAEMARRAGLVVGAGGAVLVNAVFDRQADRSLIAQAATEAGVRFDGVWLHVEPEILRRRVADRSGGPSDATVDVLAQQIVRFHGPGDWRRVDAGAGPETVCARVLASLDDAAPDGSRSVTDPG